MEDILSNDALVISGQIKLLGLDILKEKLENKWLSSLDEVHEFLIATLQKHLSYKDLFYNKPDEEFIVVFASSDDEHAKILSATILEELTEKFLGSVETKDLIVITAILSFDGDVIFHQYNLKSLHKQHKKDEAQNIEKRKKSVKKRKTKKATFNLEYRPILNVKKQVITSYYINTYTYMNIDQSNNALSKKLNYDVLRMRLTKKEAIGLDLSTLSSSIAKLKELHKNKIQAMINIPISYETVYTVNLLMEYDKICRDTPQHLQKYIRFTLLNVPQGVPATKLQFITATLKNYGSSVMLSCLIANQNFTPYKKMALIPSSFIYQLRKTALK